LGLEPRPRRLFHEVAPQLRLDITIQIKVVDDAKTIAQRVLEAGRIGANAVEKRVERALRVLAQVARTRPCLERRRLSEDAVAEPRKFEARFVSLGVGDATRQKLIGPRVETLGKLRREVRRACLCALLRFGQAQTFLALEPRKLYGRAKAVALFLLLTRGGCDLADIVANGDECIADRTFARRAAKCLRRCPWRA